jgi:integrase/recombinase XerD
VQQLLAAALKLPTNRHRTPLYPWKYHCLIGLLSTTGMRMSEVLDLHVPDVDLDQALLTIRGAKLGKIRCISLHPSTRDVLADYLRRRTEFFGAAVSPYVFVSSRGNRLDQAGLHRTFYALSRSVGLRAADASQGPRLHDFRHRFAVKVLTAWYESDQDAARLLPVLSTYLGHVRVEDTYWYLSAWPELMSHAMARLERRWGASS